MNGRAWRLAAVAAVPAATGGGLHAQSPYPAKTIRLIAPIQPGGGVDLVAHRGIGPAFADLPGGQTPMMLPGLAAALPRIRGGKVKPLGVTGTARHRRLPDVATFEELGCKGFDGLHWYGIVGPAKMPPETVKRLNEEISSPLEGSDLRERLSGALEPMPMTAEQFGQSMQADIARRTRIAREQKIQLD